MGRMVTNIVAYVGPIETIMVRHALHFFAISVMNMVIGLRLAPPSTTKTCTTQE